MEEARAKKLAYLEELAAALEGSEVTADIASSISNPFLKVANRAIPALNERAYCRDAGDGSWAYAWQWGQLIGPVDDLEKALATITSVLRPAEEA
jgi:hypothetical protein